MPTSTSSAAEMAAAEEEGQAQAETVSTVAATKQAATIDTLSKACAYGDMDRLKTLLLESGASALAKPDAEGYYPLQWACLNNQVGCAKFLLEDALCRKHVQIDAQDTTTGQTALHWAAVRGCVGILALMHDYGASAVIRDNKGYTSAHVAAQYGQTEFLYFLKMRCKIDVTHTYDNDLRSCLHWACYQGHLDTAKLLLYLGSDLTHADREKCTPLHWAAIKGNGHIVHMLINASSLLLPPGADRKASSSPSSSSSSTAFIDLREEYILEKDSTGSNSMELAKQKGHTFVSNQIEAELRKLQAYSRKNKVLRTIIELEFLPILVIVIAAMLIGYTRSIVFVDSRGENVPATAASVFWAFAVLMPSIVGLGFLYRCWRMDPGFLLTGQAKSNKMAEGLERFTEMSAIGNGGVGAGEGGDVRNGDMARESEEQELLFPQEAGEGVKVGLDFDLESAALWRGQWTQICPTCRIVKPLRAKHDAITNRCVEHFDHHCPWVGNAIGKANRWHFIVFLVLQMVALVISVSMAGYKLAKLRGPTPNAGYIVGFLVMDASLSISVLTLLAAQINSVARNMTTNEMANYHRYTYLAQDSLGRVFNPFDKGCRHNCLEVMYPSKGIGPEVLDEDSQRKLREWAMDKMTPPAPCCRPGSTACAHQP